MCVLAHFYSDAHELKSVCVQHTVTEGTGESLQGCKLNTLHCSAAHHDSDRPVRMRKEDNDMGRGIKRGMTDKKLKEDGGVL